MTLKSLTNLILQKTGDTTTIELTYTFDEAYSFIDEALTKEVTCSTDVPQSAGTYTIVAAASATIGDTSDGSNSIIGVTFSIVNEPKTLSIIQIVVEEDPCDGKAQSACTGTCFAGMAKYFFCRMYLEFSYFKMYYTWKWYW